MRQSAWRFLSAITVISASAMIATAAQYPQQGRNEQAKRVHRTALSRQVSGPGQTLQAALAGVVQPTAEILLTPVADTFTGPYGHGGYYSNTDINGQRLTVSSTGGRTFWNAQVRNWGQQKVRSFEVRVNSLGLLGANADCGGGPGSCVDAANLVPADQSCTTTPDCIAAAGESAPLCAQGLCDYAWVARTRADWVFANNFGAQSGCGVIDPAGANCFGALDDPTEARIDDGPTYYLATYAFDVPIGAKGVYTLSWTAPGISTFLGDDSLPPVNMVLAAAIPGELEVICTQNIDCDDNNACTLDTCNTYCNSQPIPQWNPETMCCDPATGAIENLPPQTPCTESFCTADGTAVVNQLPAGDVCDLGDPCIVNETCTEAGECVGTVDIGSNCPKPRYITFTPTATLGDSSIEVTLVSLHQPSPQSQPALDFSEFEGQMRWVSEPFDCSNSIGRRSFLKCATLTCTPVVFDYWSVLKGDALHITGDAIIPSSVYDIEQYREPSGVGDLPVRSSIGVETARWGDVVAPFQDPSATTRTQPNVNDLTEVIDRARDIFQALDKPRVQLRGRSPNSTAAVGIVDISLASDAVNGLTYPYGAPSPCLP